MATKIDIIIGAYSQLRISGITVQPTPTLQELGLIRLEDMMEEYFGTGICVGYDFEDTPDPNSETQVDRKFHAMMKSNLAVRLIPDFNKLVPQQLSVLSSGHLSRASSMVAMDRIREVIYPRRMPRGSGNARRNNRWRRFQNPEQLPPNTCEVNGLLENDINDYEESYDAYLGGEVIDTFTIESDPGLTVVSSSNNTPIINYRVKADENRVQGVWQQIKIVITTDTGRIETRLINFIINSDDIRVQT